MRVLWVLPFVFSSIALMGASDAEARSFRVAQIPNGSQFGCAMCHINPNGGGTRTGFGGAVESGLIGDDADWATLYAMDSDADGYPNGVELGDPDGTWVIGAANPPGPVYNPADNTSNPCGDGIIQSPPEECDGDDLQGVTCDSLGWGPGTVECSTRRCRIIDIGCEGAPDPLNPDNNGMGNNGTTNNASTNNGTANQGTNNGTDGSGDGETNDGSGASDDESGGCRTASGSPSTWLIAVFLAGAIVVRRRISRRVR